MEPERKSTGALLNHSLSPWPQEIKISTLQSWKSTLLGPQKILPKIPGPVQKAEQIKKREREREVNEIK